jgi:hypothetical protein
MSMTAKELRKRLKGVPDDVVIVMSKDAEGNSYSPLADTTPIGQYHYEASCTWAGDIKRADEPDPEAEDGFYYDPDEREAIRQLPACVVLWPTN